MKTFKFLMPFLLVTFVLVGCDTDDLRNDIDELKNRVESLEAQVSAINENMNVLRVLVDGNKTIYSCDYDEENDKYTLVLSDGQTIVLSQGVEGVATTPNISISEDGYWIIDGVKQTIKAEGKDALTPKFRIGEAPNYYWEVDLDGEGSQYDYETVKDSEGNPVKASTSESISMSDEFFEDVKVENGCLVVTLKDGSGTYSLPIVENLICEIVDPTENFKDNVLTVGYGETVKITVKIKGDKYAVTAPAGWTAILGEPSAETNEAILSLTAPAQVSTLSRATADNTKDLTLQVNSGVNWAVDKIQVIAENIIDSYYDLFNSGETIEIAGIELKKSDWESVSNFAIKQITSAGNGTDDNKITQNGIYFVQPGAIAVYAFTGAVTNMFIVRDNSNDNTAVLKMNEYARLNNNSDAENSKFLCEGLSFDASEATNYQFTANGGFGHIIFKNCSMKFTTAKSVVYISAERTLNSVVFENCKIDLTGRTEKQLFNIQKTTLSSITLKNNIFYAENGDVTTQIFNFGTSYDAPSFTMMNNTFVNVVPLTNGFVNCKAISNIDVQNNLFYSSDYTNNQLLFRYVGDTDDSSLTTTGIVSKNFANKGNKTWKVFYGNSVIDGGEQIDNTKETIFSVMDFENVVFTPVDELSGYGATIE